MLLLQDAIFRRREETAQSKVNYKCFTSSSLNEIFKYLSNATPKIKLKCNQPNYQRQESQDQKVSKGQNRNCHMAGHIILPYKNLNRDQEKRFVLMCKPNERKRKIIQVQELQQEYKIRRIIQFHLAKEMPLKDLEVNFNLLITNWGGDKAMGLFRIDRQRRWSKQFGQLLQNGKLVFFKLQKERLIEEIVHLRSYLCQQTLGRKRSCYLKDRYFYQEKNHRVPLQPSDKGIRFNSRLFMKIRRS